jgi:hypothetical protein
MKKAYKKFQALPVDRKYLWVFMVGLAIVLLLGKIFGK